MATTGGHHVPPQSCLQVYVVIVLVTCASTTADPAGIGADDALHLQEGPLIHCHEPGNFRENDPDSIAGDTGPGGASDACDNGRMGLETLPYQCLQQICDMSGPRAMVTMQLVCRSLRDFGRHMRAVTHPHELPTIPALARGPYPAVSITPLGLDLVVPARGRIVGCFPMHIPICNLKTFRIRHDRIVVIYNKRMVVLTPDLQRFRSYNLVGGDVAVHRPLKLNKLDASNPIQSDVAVLNDGSGSSSSPYIALRYGRTVQLLDPDTGDAVYTGQHGHAVAYADDVILTAHGNVLSVIQVRTGPQCQMSHHVLWTREMPICSNSQYIIRDGYLVHWKKRQVPSHLFVLDLLTGRCLWQRDLLEVREEYNSVLVSHSTVFVSRMVYTYGGGDKFDLLLLDLETGTEYRKDVQVTWSILGGYFELVAVGDGFLITRGDAQINIQCTIAVVDFFTGTIMQTSPNVQLLQTPLIGVAFRPETFAPIRLKMVQARDLLRGITR